jgi:hypothetical protein
MNLSQIQEQLVRRLKECGVADRIAFYDSAVEELRKISRGDWKNAELYAGVIVLDALQHQKTTIDANDVQESIQRADVFEAIHLMLAGKNIWDDVRYIGTQAPTITPEGIQLTRMLRSWDANRTRNAMNAMREGTLPQYALVDQIQYEEGIMGPEVTIPFRYEPSKDEIRAVAQNLANFVSKHTGQPQEVEDISRDDFAGGGSSWGQYIIKEKNPEKDPLLVDRNYRVTKGFGYQEGAQGVVSITRGFSCTHDEKTLEAYVLSIKSQKE